MQVFLLYKLLSWLPSNWIEQPITFRKSFTINHSTPHSAIWGSYCDILPFWGRKAFSRYTACIKNKIIKKFQLNHFQKLFVLFWRSNNNFPIELRNISNTIIMNSQLSRKIPEGPLSNNPLDYSVQDMQLEKAVHYMFLVQFS